MPVINVPKTIEWVVTGDEGEVQTFVLDWKSASKSIFVRNFFGEEEDTYEVAEDVSSETFRLEWSPVVMGAVVDELRSANASDRRLQHWSEDPPFLVEVAKAANFLNIPELVDRCCRKMAELITGKTPSQIRAMFRMPEEESRQAEEEARKKLQWLLE